MLLHKFNKKIQLGKMFARTNAGSKPLNIPISNVSSIPNDVDYDSNVSTSTKTMIVSPKKLPVSPETSDPTNTSKLLIAVSELEERYGLKLKSFPRVVVVGLQSSGKSSVIEAICGESILPKAMKLASRKPVHITTIRSQTRKFKIGDREIFNDIEAAQEIDRLNNNSHVTKINVTIWSPDVYNAFLVDLPGLFVFGSKDNADFPKVVKELTTTYLQDANNIPVIVHAGPSDPATDQALKFLDKLVEMMMHLVLLQK